MTIMTKPADGRGPHRRSTRRSWRRRHRQAEAAHRRGRQGARRRAHDRPVQGAHQPRPAAFHEAARLPQGQDRARRGHVLHRPERPQDPRFLRRLRLAGLRPQPSAHPRGARSKFQEEKRHEIAIAFMSQYAAALAYNIAACSPGELDMVFLGSSGSEAMEAAIKVAERAAGPKRPKIVYAENSFHGKTKGVLSITDGQLYRGEFKLVDNTVRVPFGDIDAVENAFRSDPDDRRHRAGNHPGRRRHRPGAGRILAEAARAVRPVRRASGSPTKCSAAMAAPAASMPSSITASCPTSPRWPSRSAAARRRSAR